MSVKKMILVVLILLLTGVLSVFAHLIYQKKQTLNSASIPSPTSQAREAEPHPEKVGEKTDLVPEENQITGVMSEDQRKKELEESFANPIQTFKAKLISIEGVKVNVLLESGNETTLIMSADRTSFKRKFEKDGVSVVEEVGLSELKADKELEIQYNKEKEEVVLILILN